jgi:hypothetical protein
MFILHIIGGEQTPYEPPSVLQFTLGCLFIATIIYQYVKVQRKIRNNR